jgi:phospholipase C
MGFRVPFAIVSPWTRGNIIYSEVMDHTSVLRLIELRFNVSCKNISPWRRAMAGDMTAAFDFSSFDPSWPVLPNTSNYANESNYECENLPPPSVPAEQSYPTQEPGTRISRALPYEFKVYDSMIASSNNISLTVNNTGKQGAPFLLISGVDALVVTPRKYAVEAGKFIVDNINLALNGTRYAIALHGPNGFVRQFGGDLSNVNLANALSATLDYNPSTNNVLVNLGYSTAVSGIPSVSFTITDNAYGAAPSTQTLTAPQQLSVQVPVSKSGNWYDLTVSVTIAENPVFQRRFMGRMETGVDTISDPAMAAGIPANGPGIDSVLGFHLQGSKSTKSSEHPLLPEHARFFKRAKGDHKDAVWHWTGFDSDEL